MFSLQRKPVPSCSEQRFREWSLVANDLATSEHSVLGLRQGSLGELNLVSWKDTLVQKCTSTFGRNKEYLEVQ